jgi:hypothetical protein
VRSPRCVSSACLSVYVPLIFLLSIRSMSYQRKVSDFFFPEIPLILNYVPQSLSACGLRTAAYPQIDL